MHSESGSNHQRGPWRVSPGAAVALAVAVLGAFVIGADRSAHAHRAEVPPALAVSVAPLAAAPERSTRVDSSVPSAWSVFEHRMVLPEELPAQF